MSNQDAALDIWRRFILSGRAYVLTDEERECVVKAVRQSMEREALH